MTTTHPITLLGAVQTRCMHAQLFMLVLLTAVFSAGAFTTPASADGLIVIHQPTRVPPGHYPFAPLEVKHHHVEVTITDQIAVTSIDQVFHNPNSAQLEGTYLFPIPKNAQIDRFTMDVNGKQMEAELLDAAQARKIYEDIVRSMKDPALLEYVGQGLFKVRIFPIEAHSDKHVTLKYSQVLSQDSGVVEYLYPLNTEKFSAAPINSVSLKINLQISDPLDAIYCPTHAVEIKRHSPHEAVIGFEASHVKPDTDFSLFFSTAPSADAPIGLSMLTYRERVEEDGYFMLFATPQHFIADAEVQAKDIIFVLDTSGSMAGNKLVQAKRALQFCLANLNAEDRFEIIRFSTDIEPVFGALESVSEASRARAESFIEGLKPIGGTAIDGALTLASQIARGRAESTRPCMVIFLTDGRPTVGATGTDQIVHNLELAVGDDRLRVFCFGIGTDVNTHLLDRITERTRAVSQYVLPEEDIEVKVSNFYTKVDSPVLVDPTFRIEGAIRARALYPYDLPDVFRGEQLIVVGRYSGAGDGAIMIEGHVNGEKTTIVHESAFPEVSDDHEFIPRLWATRRIGYLLDEIRLHGENDELRDEVTQLARKYGIVTPYTAYLIVEDEVRRNVPADALTLRVMVESESSQREAAEIYAMQRAQVGRDAVDAAASNTDLKFVGTVGGSVSGVAGLDGNQLAEPASLSPSRRAEAERLQRLGIDAQTVRNAGGKTFYLNDDVWVDAEIAQRLGDDAELKRTMIAFGSDAYFELMTAHPRIAPWLSIGTAMHFCIGDTIYEIMPVTESANDGDKK